MKKLILLTIAIAAMCAQPCKADDLKSILGKITGSDIGNVVSGIIGNDEFDVSNLEGSWKATGPAVMFKSDDLLQKAGGSAISTAVEKKLKPYYTKLKLDKSAFTFDGSGNFTMTVNSKSIKGTISKNSDGSYALKFGSSEIASKLGGDKSVTVYLQLSGNTLSIAGDVKKMIELAKKFSNLSSTLNSLVKFLVKYDEICIGVKYTKQ